MDSKNISIGVIYGGRPVGSIGDTLCLTPIIEHLYKEKNSPVTVYSSLSDLFLNNPYVDKIIYENNPSISLSPCLLYSCNIIQYYFAQLGIDIPKGNTPKIYLSSEEINYGMNALQKFNERKRIAVCLTGSCDSKSLRYHLLSPFLDKLKEDGYVLIGVGNENFENGYKFDKSFINKTTIREVISIINGCHLYIGVDTGLSHIAAALDVPQIVFYRNNESSNNSYRNTHFIENRIKCTGGCLKQHLTICEKEKRCMDNFDLYGYYKLVQKVLPLSSKDKQKLINEKKISKPGNLVWEMFYNSDDWKSINEVKNNTQSQRFINKRTCYVINFYLGDRRFDIDTYATDKLCYLKTQIECLNRYKHSLSKIIFNFNVEPSHYSQLNKALKIIPKIIQNTEVEINIRENIGLSYGAFSEIFGTNMDAYDYYIFNEDDYVIVQDNFDEYLVNKFNSLPNCGYLCGLVRETTDIHAKHAGMSSGISSYSVLKKVYDKFGELPYAKSGDYSDNECISQVGQSNAFLQIGYDIYDIREDYRMQMKSSEKQNGYNVVHRYFMWQDKDLFLPTNIYLDEFHIWYDQIGKEYLRMECNVNSTKYFKY